VGIRIGTVSRMGSAPVFCRRRGVSPLPIAVNIRQTPSAHFQRRRGPSAFPVGQTPTPTAIGGGIITLEIAIAVAFARKLGNVEHRMPGVCSGDENTVDASKAAHERAPAQAKIARSIFRMVGENAAHHDIAIHLIGESRSIPLAVSFHSLCRTRERNYPPAGYPPPMPTIVNS